MTVSRRLGGPAGLPVLGARAGVAALMVAAAVIGYLSGPDGAEPAVQPQPAVASSRLSGELPTATPDPHPKLRAAAALPAIRRSHRPARRAAPKAAAKRAPAPAATAAPAAPTRVPVATPSPSAPAATPRPAPSAAPPPPRPAPAPAPAPSPAPTPAPTFDSSG